MAPAEAIVDKNTNEEPVARQQSPKVQTITENGGFKFQVQRVNDNAVE